MNFNGTNNADTLNGGTAADYMVGFAGNDVLNGGGGNDGLYGGSGNDVLNGGSGNDLLAGQGGSDYLTGGLGNDTFLFSAGDSLGEGDHILDFVRGQDVIKFSTVSAKTVVQTLESDGDLIIHYGTLGGAPGPNQGTIVVEHVGHYLTSSDFLFT